jgi:TolA-binding protein
MGAVSVMLQTVGKIGLMLCVTVLLFAQDEQTLPDISEKKAELNEKNVEVLELQSNVKDQNEELQSIREEIERLKEYNQHLEDSLSAKQSEIDSLKTQQSEVDNFRMIVNAINEDKTLTDEILESIKSSEVVFEDTITPVLDLDDTAYRTRYNEALNQYFDRNFEDSIRKFTYLLQLSGQHPLSDNCQYWLGENLYSQEKYPAAIEAFAKVAPLGDGNKADAALFKIGMSYLKMNDQDQAVVYFKRLEKEFPKSELLGKAQQYLTTQEKF